VPDEDALPEVAFAAPDPAPQAVLTVRILGGCCISTCSGVEVVQLREKAKELLAYLLLNPDGVPGERAIEALWPEVDPRSGRDRFRTVLSNLRGQLAGALGELGPPPVERIGAICRVDPAAIDCDVWRFEAALGEARNASTPQEKRAAYVRAADAYGGDLLDGADCAWAEAPRERLRDLAVGALCRQAELAQADCDDETAVAALERAVDLDPYGEETARRLILLQAHFGNPDAARRVYRRLSRVLQDDLDVDPSPKTRAVFEDILRKSRGRAETSVRDR
jgi:DNA-binding SARP family transcriptional activator